MKKNFPIIFCINLDRRIDRWNDMKRQFEENNLTYYRLLRLMEKKFFKMLKMTIKKVG